MKESLCCRFRIVPKLYHYDENGSVRMVDVGDKVATKRTARAHAFVKMSKSVLQQLPQNPKGNPLEIARIAGIQGAKKTSELIPLCHPLGLTQADVQIDLTTEGAEIIASVSPTSQTGVEMEDLTAATTAALTINDMCKALDKSIEITGIYLLEKTGGKSGDYVRNNERDESVE